MKTILWVSLCLLFISACNPAAPGPQAQPTPAEDVIPWISLNPDDIPQASQVSALDPASISQFLREVLDLAAQRRVDLLEQEGWLHIWTRNVQTRSEPLSPFDPGLSHFEQDQWLSLDENGQMQEAVVITLGESGEILQVSRLYHGIWVNLTLGAQSQAETPASFDPNYGFDQLAARMVQQGRALNKGLLYKDCWYQGEKYTIADGQWVYEAVFDTGYRELRSIKTWQVASNGDVSLVNSLEILLEEWAPQPPPDVLAHLPGF